MIQPVIAMPEKQREKVLSLVEYCENLDGTKVRVFPISQKEDQSFRALYSNNAFPCLQAFGLRKVAEGMKGNPFIWLEPDSIPLRKGWAEILSAEYEKLGKPYMLSSDTHPPGDLVGGIGVYGPDTSWMIPTQFKEHGWDLWMVKHLRPLISFTPLIQHKYGVYEGWKKVRDLSFPKDQSLIREDSVIFHRDSAQSLIKSSREFRFHFSNDMGDLIAALPIVRQLGGGHITIGNHPQMAERGWREMKGYRYECIRPLLEKQPYVRSVNYSEDLEGVDYDFIEWRTAYKSKRSLLESQAAYINLNDVDQSPWLCVDPDPRANGKVVVARSPRYQNRSFPWKRIGDRFKGRMIFVGLKEEHNSLESVMGNKAEYMPCENLLETARLVAASDLLIVNQTSTFWIGAGLGHPLVQETCLNNPDSIVKRANAQYVPYGNVRL